MLCFVDGKSAFFLNKSGGECMGGKEEVEGRDCEGKERKLWLGCKINE